MDFLLTYLSIRRCLYSRIW